MDERKKKLSLWGILLAWLPFVPGILNAFKGITEQKATGLGAVAGGVAESLFWFGLVVTVVSEISAIVLLLKGFSRGHWVRSFFSVLSILF